MNQSISSAVTAQCQKICAVIGLGVSNLPLVEFLRAHGAAVTVRERRQESALGNLAERVRALGAGLVTGEDYLGDLHEQLIFRSPGIRPDLPAFCRAVERGSRLTTETEWFLELCPALSLGITGSDGKTTTTTLTGLFLRQEQKGKIFVGGNIGTPLLSEVESMTESDFAVVELSSFQLQGCGVSPNRACVTNLSPNHLDWHRDMEEYIAAKTNVFTHPDCRMLVLNADNAPTAALAARATVPVTFFSSTGKPINAEKSVFAQDGMIYTDFGSGNIPVMPVDSILLPGRHNLENYLAAIALTEGLVSPASVAKVAETFTGVEHRLQKVGTVGGVTYYNSSIDSTPSRTRAALCALAGQGVHPVVICGGYDKKLSFAPLAKALKTHAKAVVLTGATAEKIEKAVRDETTDLPLYREPDFKRAVELAKSLAKPGDVVLLSPACASFDAFANFAERGRTFCTIVKGFETENG